MTKHKVKLCPGRLKNKCEFCDKEFEKKEKLMDHLKNDHKKTLHYTSFKCHFCEIICENEALLQKHCQDQHRDSDNMFTKWLDREQIL